MLHFKEYDHTGTYLQMRLRQRRCTCFPVTAPPRPQPPPLPHLCGLDSGGTFAPSGACLTLNLHPLASVDSTLGRRCAHSVAILVATSVTAQTDSAAVGSGPLVLLVALLGGSLLSGVLLCEPSAIVDAGAFRRHCHRGGPNRKGGRASRPHQQRHCPCD